MAVERTYKTIKWVLKGHIKNGVNSLWTWEEDNFTCIYDNYEDYGIEGVGIASNSTCSNDECDVEIVIIYTK